MRPNSDVKVKQVISGKTMLHLLDYDYWLEYEIATDGSLIITLPGDVFEMCETGTRETEDKKRTYGYYKFRFIGGRK